MGNPRLKLKIVPLVLLSACATKLVDRSELDEAPQDFSVKISDLGPGVVDLTQEVSLAEVIATKPATTDAVPSKTAAPTPISKKPPPASVAKKTVKAQHDGWKAKAWPYGIGEVAEYSLRYGVIEGGVVEMRTLEPKMLDGVRALHYQANVRSTKLLELFYKVDDTIQTWVSMENHLPLRQEIEQRESAQWGTRVVTFDVNAQTAKFYSTTEKKDKKKKIERLDSALELFPQDIFGSLYFFRFVEPRERVNFAIHDKGKGWSNETTYLGTETLNLPVGKIRARRYKLQPRISGNLETKGDVEGWFADDETRIMVRFKAAIKFGTISGDLRKYQPGKRLTVDPPWMRSPIDLTSLGDARVK